MARPIKTGMDYFSHDVNCKQDPKLKYILAEWKAFGYMAYFSILEMIYNNNGYYCEWSDLDSTILGSEIGVTPDEFEKLFNDLFKFKLFEKTLYDQFKILTSSSIQRRFLEQSVRRKEIEIVKDFLLINPKKPKWSKLRIVKKDLSETYNALINDNINNFKCNINNFKNYPIVQRKENKNEIEIESKENKNEKESILVNKTTTPTNAPDRYIENVNEFFNGKEIAEIKPEWQKAISTRAINLDNELQRAKTWLLSNTSKQKKDFKRFLNNWINGEIKQYDEKPERNQYTKNSGLSASDEIAKKTAATVAAFNKKHGIE